MRWSCPLKDCNMKKLDVDFMEMMKDIVGRGEFDVYLVDELKRQIDTLTLRQKYHFNRFRPREAATYYNPVLTSCRCRHAELSKQPCGSGIRSCRSWSPSSAVKQRTHASGTTERGFPSESWRTLPA